MNPKRRQLAPVAGMDNAKGRAVKTRKAVQRIVAVAAFLKRALTNEACLTLDRKAAMGQPFLLEIINLDRDVIRRKLRGDL